MILNIKNSYISERISVSENFKRVPVKEKGTFISSFKGLDSRDDKNSNLSKLVNKGCSETVASKYSESPDLWDKVIELSGCNFSPFGIKQYLSLSDDKYKTALSYASKGYGEYCSFRLAFLPENIQKKVLPLIEYGKNLDDLISIAQLDNDKYDRVLSLLSGGFNLKTAKLFIDAPKERYNKAIQLQNAAKNNKDDYTNAISKICLADDDSFERANALIDKGIDINKTAEHFDILLKYDYETLSSALDCLPSDLISKFDSENNLNEIINSYEFQKNEEIFSMINNSGIKSKSIQKTVGLIILSQLFKDNLDLNQLELSEKLSIKSDLHKLRNIFSDDCASSYNNFKHLHTENLEMNINKSLTDIITPYEVSDEDLKIFAEGFLANKERTDNVLKNFDFAKYAKKGLPLEYTRINFLHDLNTILGQLPVEKRDEIINKLDIEAKINQSGLISGYDGVINLDKLNLNRPLEKQVYDISYKYIHENKVNTGDKDADYVLNSLIKGIPEFMNVIGKRQHIEQDYSVDIHTIMVLQTIMNSEKYDSFNNEEKTILKLGGILHDISKSEGVVDRAHPDNSSLYAKSVLKRFKLSDTVKNRIFEFIKNHHWNQYYNNELRTAEETAALFRYNNDFEMAKLMGYSDLKNVSSIKYKQLKYSLDSSHMKPIERALNKIKQQSSIIYTDTILFPNKIPSVEKDGYSYRVIDFTKLKNNEDLFRYGFQHDVTPDNVRFLVHMFHDSKDAKKNQQNLSKLEYIFNNSNGSNISNSYISPYNKKTFSNRKFGVIIESNSPDISSAVQINRCSGMKKGIKSYISTVTSRLADKTPEQFVIPYSIQKTLNISPEEYVDFYNKFCANKFMSQIKDNIEYKIGDKTITGSEIKKAIRKADDELLQFTKWLNINNEVTVLNPKFNAFAAKVDSFDEINDEYLQFIRNNNLPVLILGSGN